MNTSNKYCTNEQNKVLSEVYRRLNYFHKGNLHESLMLLAWPSEVKKVAALGLLKPYHTETPKVLNWYNLTEKGKKYFEKYVESITEQTNSALFDGTKVIKFLKPQP